MSIYTYVEGIIYTSKLETCTIAVQISEHRISIYSMLLLYDFVPYI